METRERISADNYIVNINSTRKREGERGRKMEKASIAFGSKNDDSYRPAILKQSIAIASSDPIPVQRNMYEACLADAGYSFSRARNVSRYVFLSFPIIFFSVNFTHLAAKRQKAMIHWRDLIITSSCSPIIAYYYFSFQIYAHVSTYVWWYV